MIMSTTRRILHIFALAVASMFLCWSVAARAQGTADPTPQLKVLRAAATALGQIRMSDIGVTNPPLPLVDVVTTMEIIASGVVYNNGQPANATYTAAFAYIPPAMRVEIKGQGGGNAANRIQTVREEYAWDESERGAGLIPGKGIATPAMASAKSRLLQLWILPYGVVKAAIAAGDKTTISTAQGSTVITFPLSGALAGITVTATLDANNFITKVATKPDNAAATDLVYEAEYSDYADHGEILTDVKSPGHIVERVAGKPLLDVKITKVDANNPYLVFPVPPNVKAARAQAASSR
jgi:hypothetical protein